jgi:mRNA-degrading endonuclease RelE of RelBE toxin-antitoxin system
MEIFYTDTARRQIRALEKQLQGRILDKVKFFASQNDPLDFAEPLTGLDAFRFRIGDYRITFQIHQQLLFVLSVRRRDEAYR